MSGKYSRLRAYLPIKYSVFGSAMPRSTENEMERRKEPVMDDTYRGMEQSEDFRRLMKAGIYKELHRRALLTDAQLDSLLRRKQ